MVCSTKVECRSSCSCPSQHKKQIFLVSPKQTAFIPKPSGIPNFSKNTRGDVAMATSGSDTSLCTDCSKIYQNQVSFIDDSRLKKTSGSCSLHAISSMTNKDTDCLRDKPPSDSPPSYDQATHGTKLQSSTAFEERWETAQLHIILLL